MGLDQYAIAVPAAMVGDTEVDHLETEPENSVLIARWRKHPNLHGWMERLYRTKGGKQEQFNCATVRLREADLDHLYDAVNHEKLPDTAGFFFGESTPEDLYDDIRFIATARAELARGNAVFYDSWW